MRYEKPKTKKGWEEFAKDISEKVAEALDYFCWNISGDTPLECYSAHSDFDLFDLAQEFAGWSASGITEEELELLREMPDDIHDKYSRRLQRQIEKVIDKLRKEGGEESEW
mgnify:CR=1 FL=1